MRFKNLEEMIKEESRQRNNFFNLIHNENRDLYMKVNLLLDYFKLEISHGKTILKKRGKI